MSKLALVSYLKNILSPPYCIYCESLLSDHIVLCVACQQKIPKIASQQSRVTRSRYLTIHAYTAYQEPFEKLIHAKLNSQQGPIQQLAYLLAQYAKARSFSSDYIVPIPLYWQRNMWRGFNQSEILAHAVARTLDASLMHPLKRIKNTRFQSSLSAPERKRNLEDAFLCIMPVKNKKILLIDDLFTTGATATAAAHELYKHGAAAVELLVVCKVID